MGSIFYRCLSLTSLDFSKFRTEKMIYMNRLFYKCSNLKYIDFSSFNVTSNILLFDNTLPENGKIIILNNELLIFYLHRIFNKIWDSKIILRYNILYRSVLYHSACINAGGTIFGSY